MSERRLALISTWDKTGVVEFARGLIELGFEIVSTGGTARKLREEGLPVTDVSEVTGFPEMMDGRVKTLHPKIHGGILALRSNPDHIRQMREADIRPIDVVAVNLYPFAATITQPGVTEAQAIEQIDIGGPCMVRAAAKNFRFVTVVVRPDDYPMVLAEMRANHGETTLDTRRRLAVAAFQHTAQYDETIHKYLSTL